MTRSFCHRNDGKGKSLVLGFAYGLVKVSRGVRKGALVVGAFANRSFINMRDHSPR